MQAPPPAPSPLEVCSAVEPPYVVVRFYIGTRFPIRTENLLQRHFNGDLYPETVVSVVVPGSLPYNERCGMEFSPV